MNTFPARQPLPALRRNSTPPIDDERWRAITARDKTHDGEFVYAVRTTGVYCRPSCASRLARRENVEFFDTTHLARAAGYRPCKRCGPDEAPLEQRHNALVLAACRRLQASESGVALEDLARDAGMSPHHFHRVFKAVTGLTPKAYHMALRNQRLQHTLKSRTTTTEALFDAGFNSSARFYDTSRAALGMSPRAYREGGRDQAIRYAVETCALGVILVGATVHGLCAIEFGDSAHALVERLRERFPLAQFEPGDAVFLEWIAQVLAYVETPRGLLDLPLDVQGTVFQRRVWQALRDIPSGKTASYADVARAIGEPKAVRAVAQACAGNPLALAVPCHRVVKSDGTLGGYRWGLERKAELLRRESEA